MTLLNETFEMEEAIGRNLRNVAHQHFANRTASNGPLADKSRTEPLETLIEESLRPRMPLCSGLAADRDRDSVMNDYSESIAVLQQAIEDVKDFVGRLWRINVSNELKDDFVEQVAGKFTEEYYGKLIDPVAEQISSHTGAVSARLETRSVDEVETVLRGRLDRHLGIFAGEVKELFERLRQLELVGRVDWATDDACDSYYCEDLVVHESGETTTYYGARENVQADYTIGRTRIREETLDVTKTRHTMYHGLHVKVVAEAKRNRVGRFEGVVPKEIADFLRATPPWLGEAIQIVDGKTRFDDVVDVRIDLAERVVGEPRIRYLVPPAYCPLVILGDYVLTGWGSREGAIETARQNYGWFYAVAVALVALSGIMSGLGRLEDTWIGYAAVVPAILSLAAFVEGRRQEAISTGRSTDLFSLLGKGVFWFVLCLGVQALGSGLALMNWMLIVLGGILTWGGASGLLEARPVDDARE